MNDLKHVYGRVIVEVDLEKKNSHRCENGLILLRPRQYNNLNRRETEPVNAIVISGEDMPSGVEILIHPNAIHDSNKIFNYRQFSGKDEASDIKYYSIRESDCFIYLDTDNVWKPLKPFETALRIFKPYLGLLKGVDAKKIEDTLFVTSGRLKNKVVKTVKAADYEIIFQDTNGREGNLIRFRPDGHVTGDETKDREAEAIAIMEDVTKKVLNGEYLVGISLKDAKSLKKPVYERN